MKISRLYSLELERAPVEMWTYSKELIGTVVLFTLFCLNPAPVASQGNPMLRPKQTRAVIVGISEYQNISGLDYAHRDAEAFAAYLKSPAGGSVPDENIQLFTNKAATQMQFAMALDWIQEESRAGDRAIIYFSGHGDVEKKTARQRGFLLTYDAPGTTYMAGGAFPILFLQDIVSSMSTENGVEVILLADACRSGTLAGNNIGGNHITAEKLAESFANEIKILSCQKDELSQEGPQWGEGRGVFSYHLIEGLIGLADGNADEEVTLREIRNYLESQVGEATSSEQMPLVVGDLGHSLSRVDAESLALLKEKKANETMKSAVAVNTRGLSSPDPDSVIWKLYLDFQKAIDNKHFLYPAEGAAYTLYNTIKDEEIIQPHRSKMKRNLATALHDEAQQAINNYLEVSPEEMQKRWSYNERYDYYPEFLGVAADLLGPGHFMYQDLKIRQLYFEGLRLRLRGEKEENRALFTEAMSKQEEVIRRDSSAAYAYNEIGLLYRRLDRKAEAIRFFEMANHFSPNWVLPMANSISSFTEIGKVDSALEIGQRALAIDSSFALVHHNLGFAYDAVENWPKAIDHYEKAIQLNPDYTSTYYNLALLYFGLKKLDQTEKYFLLFAEKLPEPRAAIWSDLGFVASLQDKREEAATYFAKALAVDPEFSTTYLNLGEFYLTYGQLDQAEKAYRAYLKRKPDRAVGYYMLAAVMAQKALPEAAVEQLRLAFEKGFDDLEKLAADEHFVKLRKRKDYKKLLEDYKK